MPHDPSDLATALGSRICHDLASPLGALMAGLDLLEMSGRPSPELALMRESVEGARATLDLLRLAFGPAGAGEAIGKAARMKVDQMTTGMQYNTVRQQAATRHFATTGQKVSPDLSLPPKG